MDLSGLRPLLTASLSVYSKLYFTSWESGYTYPGTLAVYLDTRVPGRLDAVMLCVDADKLFFG